MSEIDTIIKDYFGTTAKAASVLGVTRAAISLWRINGIPRMRRYHIEAVCARKRKLRK